MNRTTWQSALAGAAASLALFAFYAVVLALVNGRDYLVAQARSDAPFLTFLVPSFGLVAGMFAHLRALARGAHPGTVAASGGMSGAAMIACCAHYLPTVLPFLGVTAFATVVMAWRTPLLVLAVASNLAGLAVVTRALRRALRGAAGARVRDPVCGMEIDVSAAFAAETLEGTTYRFCSQACHERFLARPSAYAASVRGA